MNILKEKLRSGAPLCGTHVSLCDPAICEIVGQLGYDFIWIDLEHTYISPRDLMSHLEAAKAAGTPAIVRVPQHDFTYTKKVLEMGPDGVIFPMIHDAAEANELIGWTLYPPLGTRGYGPLRATGFGYRDAQEYIDRDSQEMCRFIQIEHRRAVEDLENIIQNPWIDGYFFGPFDLSGSVGHLGHITDADTRAAMERTVSVLKKAGKRVGVSTGATTEEDIRYWRDLGVDVISAGSDFSHILDGAAANLKRLRKVQSEKRA